MIIKLMINEITPTEDDSLPTIAYSRTFEGGNLETKIHDFFSRHINRSFVNSKMKNLKFTNYHSTILNSSKALLGIIAKRESDDESTHFERHSKIITKKLAENIHKNVTNPFLFIVLTFEHEDDELLCLIKMEKFFGVQFVNDDLKIQLDMLPDVKTDLQKCAFIYKNQISVLTEEDFINEDQEINDQQDFHSKILDRQDESISKYFMTSFLESYVIAQDKEITKLASKHITSELSKYLKEGANKGDIKRYLEKELQKRKATSVSTLVEDVINNSDLINVEKITSNNMDNESLSLSVFRGMKNENTSAYQEFTSSPDYIEKTVIEDKVSNGRDIKIHFSKMYERQGNIQFIEENEHVTLRIKKDKIIIKR